MDPSSLPPPPPVDGDSGFAGSIVAERLQTLRVACERSWDAKAAGPQEDGEQAPLSPELLLVLREGAPANSSEPPWVALTAGDAPRSGAAAEGKPAALEGSNGRSSPGTGGEQAFPPVEHPETVEDEEEERQPSEGAKVVDRRQPSSSSSAFQGGNSEEDGDLDRQTAALCKEKPAAQRSDKKGQLSGENESRSESDSDSDADSSSSLSSSSSPPLLSDDDQQDKNENNSPTKKKSELTKKEPPLVEDLMIILPESVKLMPFGHVSSIIEHQVIIESEKGLPPVNENTVLFKENRHSLGKEILAFLKNLLEQKILLSSIFEIFGPVSHPFYVVQFNSLEHILSKDIKIKDAVYFAPAVESFTQYIFPEKLKQEKGSDASWKNDDEPPPEALDFSDDEKEKAAKSHKKSQNIKRKKLRLQQNDSNDNGPNYQSRQQQPPSEYSGGYRRGQPTTRFPWNRPPQVASFPRFYRQHNITPQYYSSDYTHLPNPPTFCQQQRLESMRRHQYSFPPPSFETVSHNANFPPPPPPPPVDWGWPPTCPQNTYEPLLSMLSLPPPPPPPPPSITPNTGNSL